MSEQEKQEGQKTVVSFIAGLLIGGLLVWVFSGSPEQTAPDTQDPVEVEVTETAEDTNETDETASDESTTEDTSTTEESTSTVEVGDGSVDVSDQAAGNTVEVSGAVFPVTEGWIAVRSYTGGQLGNILGAARFSQEQGLAPNEVPLLTPTVAGREYAVVFFNDDGNREFNLDGDAQLDVTMETFTAN